MDIAQLKFGRFLSILSQWNYDQFFRLTDGSSTSFTTVFPSGSYAIVGNNPGILDNLSGEAIDSATNVVRFGDFTTGGFEPYVGRKTTIWASHTMTGRGADMCSPLYFSGYEEPLSEKIKKISTRYGEQASKCFIIFHDDQFLHLVRRGLGFIPSSGMLLMLILCVKYPDIRTCGFGFSTYRGRTHFFSSTDASDVRMYDTERERILYDMLAAKKLINPIAKMPPLIIARPNKKQQRRIGQNIQRQTAPAAPVAQSLMDQSDANLKTILKIMEMDG